MDKHPAMLLIILVIGVIIIFILASFSVIPCLSAPNNTNKCGWVPFDNQPPEAPEIDGPVECPPGVEICYTFRSFDPNHDDIMLFIDWGDGAFEETNYFQHNIPIEVCHIYEEKETYLLRARAIDIYGYKGDWSYFNIPINDDDCNLCPKFSNQQNDRFWSIIINHEIYENILSRILRNHPELLEKYQELTEEITLFRNINTRVNHNALNNYPYTICSILGIFVEIYTLLLFTYNPVIELIALITLFPFVVLWFLICAGNPYLLI